MITIKKVLLTNDLGNTFVSPERELTPEESENILLRWGDENNYWYFERGDENKPEYLLYLQSLESSIEDRKNILRDAIDERTKELIFVGFSFAGLIFSMSMEAQINWSNFPVLYQSAPQLFPLDVHSKNDEPYELKYTDVMSFYFSAVSHKNTQLQSGNVLKQQVNAMRTAEELNNFVDPR